MNDDFKNQLKYAKKQLPAQNTAVVARKKPVESESFARMIGTVIPLESSNRYIAPAEKPFIKKRPQEASADTPVFYVGEQWQEAPAQHHKNGRGKQDIQKLLSHHYPVMGTLDLHGHKQEGLQELLSEFCCYVRNKGVCARIVHGSGLGSQQARPVLKNIVRTWLSQHTDVLAYTEESGNDGAVLVLFKKKHE